jgi:hypothetical protein
MISPTHALQVLDQELKNVSDKCKPVLMLIVDDIDILWNEPLGHGLTQHKSKRVVLGKYTGSAEPSASLPAP